MKGAKAVTTMTPEKNCLKWGNWINIRVKSSVFTRPDIEVVKEYGQEKV